MYDQSRLLVHEGNPMLPGATKVSGGMNFAVEVPCDTEASLILYRKGEKEPEAEIPFAESNRTGRMCAMMVSGFKPEQYEYNFRIDTKICQDPYARGLAGRETFGRVSEDKDEHRDLLSGYDPLQSPCQRLHQTGEGGTKEKRYFCRA